MDFFNFTLNNEHLIRVNQNPNLQYILDMRKRYEIQKNKSNFFKFNNERLKNKKGKLGFDIENKNAFLNLEFLVHIKLWKITMMLKTMKEFDIDLDNDYL